ncbi:MAG TPA: deoxyribodipyrimidine photo-lyase, partial [Aestuariivirga sp.]
MTRPVIMWFRQDLRTLDHAALNAAAAAGEVICLYVLDDETPGKWRWGGASRWWLHRSLQSLSKNLKLVLRRGRADAVIADVIREAGAGAVYFTRDYAPWSPDLERRVKDICENAGATCHRFGGYLLYEPESIRNGSGEPYKVYTPFSRACFAAGEPRLPTSAAKPGMWQGNV